MKMVKLLLLAGIILLGLNGTSMAYSYTYASTDQGGVQYTFGADSASVAFSFDLALETPYHPPTGFNDPVYSVPDAGPPFDPPLSSAWVSVTGSGYVRIILDIYDDLIINPIEIYAGQVNGNYDAPITGSLFDSLQEYGYGGVYLYAVLDQGPLTITNMGVGANPVPVPSALLLLGSGLVGLVGLKRRKTAG